MPPKLRKRITKKYAFEKDIQIKVSKLDVDKRSDKIIHVDSSSEEDEENVIASKKSRLELVETNKDGLKETDSNTQQNDDEPCIQIDFCEIKPEDNHFFRNNFEFEINSIKTNLKELTNRNKCVIS